MILGVWMVEFIEIHVQFVLCYWFNYRNHMHISYCLQYIYENNKITCYCVFINTRFDRSEFNIIDAYHMLKIAIAWQP